MANAFRTLAEMLVINDRNLADINITDVLNKAPTLARMAAIAASNGSQHKYTKETAAPATGFRAESDGRENTKSTDTAVTVTMKILDASFAVDIAVADTFKDGPEAWIQKELARFLRSAMFNAEKQMFYGTGNDAGGFAGIADNAGYNGLSDAMVYNAAGTTASTGSSLFGIKTGEDACAIVTGYDGKIDVKETVVQMVAGATTGTLPMYWTPVTAWLGLQLGGAYHVGRLANLTADSGKGLTDAKISAFLSLFPSGELPDFMVCSRRSLTQLQASRTATNATGAPAPFPTEAFGVPIFTSEAISNTETLLS